MFRTWYQLLSEVLQGVLATQKSREQTAKSCSSVTHPDGGLVAAHTVDGQPSRQVQQALEDLLVQLQVGQVTFPLQRAQVDLVWWQVLSKPVIHGKWHMQRLEIGYCQSLYCEASCDNTDPEKTNLKI